MAVAEAAEVPSGTLRGLVVAKVGLEDTTRIRTAVVPRPTTKAMMTRAMTSTTSTTSMTSMTNMTSPTISQMINMARVTTMEVSLPIGMMTDMVVDVVEDIARTMTTVAVVETLNLTEIGGGMMIPWVRIEVVVEAKGAQ